MNEQQATAVLEEYCRRQGIAPPALRDRSKRQARSKVQAIAAELFGPQKAFVLDKSPRKAADPGRRAGKTNGVARGANISALEHPADDDDIWTTYTAVTRQQAKDLFWAPLKAVNRRHKLGGIPNETELMIAMPNGHKVKLFGADKAKELEKKRGYKIAKAYVDEAGAFPPELLRYYVDEILEPATADLNGSIELIGTPSRVAMGLFHDACQAKEPGWSHHHWTMLENEYLPHAEQWLADLRKRRGWAPDNPIYLREYMGLWIVSDEGRIYHYDPAVNDFRELPSIQGSWGLVLGIDLGASDEEHKKHTAFTVIAYSTVHPVAYVRCSYKGNHMTPTEIADEIRALEKRFGQPFNRRVMDFGALGKAIAREITVRHEIDIQPAEKTDKWTYIELFDDDLRKGWIQVDPTECEPLTQEWALLQEDPEKPCTEDERFPNHCSDSALYAWRDCLNWIWRPAPDLGPEPGTPEHDDKKAEDMFEKEKEQLRLKAEGDSEEEWWATM